MTPIQVFMFTTYRHTRRYNNYIQKCFHMNIHFKIRLSQMLKTVTDITIVCD
jgi:hypothetical protein